MELPKYFLNLHETVPTGLGSARFPRRIRFGWETEPTGPGANPVRLDEDYFFHSVIFREVRCGCKPHLPDLGELELPITTQLRNFSDIFKLWNF